MKLLSVLAACLATASGLVVSPAAAPAQLAAQRAAASPTMACNGGKGGRGGKSPSKDKMRRGRLSALIQAADSAENVKSILLSSQTEQILLKMGWKFRKS